LWNEIKIWSQDATKKEKAFSEIQADRDRLWNEIQEIQSSRLYRILCSIYGTRLIKTIYKTYYSLFKNHSNKENSK